MPPLESEDIRSTSAIIALPLDKSRAEGIGKRFLK
jgi:hypothetical protein